jgi:hypothetical protein
MMAAFKGRNYEATVRTSQKAGYFSITKANQLMSYRKVIAVYRENHVEHTHTQSMWTEYRLLMLHQVVLIMTCGPERVNTGPSARTQLKFLQSIHFPYGVISNCSVVNSCYMAM